MGYGLQLTFRVMVRICGGRYGGEGGWKEKMPAHVWRGGEASKMASS